MPSPQEAAVIQQVVGKAATNREYRSRLLSDPRGTLAEAVGHALPDDFSIKFVEKDPGVDVMYVLPDVAIEDRELTAEELEAVSGGVACWITVIII
jgi:hypothetical protein